jgi:hypothetical protein
MFSLVSCGFIRYPPRRISTRKRTGAGPESQRTRKLWTIRELATPTRFDGHHWKSRLEGFVTWDTVALQTQSYSYTFTVSHRAPDSHIVRPTAGTRDVPDLSHPQLQNGRWPPGSPRSESHNSKDLKVRRCWGALNALFESDETNSTRTQIPDDHYSISVSYVLLVTCSSVHGFHITETTHRLGE